MRKINLIAMSVYLASLNAHAADNLFQPKSDGVSEEDMNIIVKNELYKQENMMNEKFDRQMMELRDSISISQSEQLNSIMARLDSMQAENEVLKEQQESLKKSGGRGYRSPDSGVSVIGESYSSEEADEELNNIFVEAEEDTMILTEDIIRLNKEFGENGLTFVAIVDENKIYKNSKGEYIIKGLDFEYDGSAQEESFDDEVPKRDVK